MLFVSPPKQANEMTPDPLNEALKDDLHEALVDFVAAWYAYRWKRHHEVADRMVAKFYPNVCRYCPRRTKQELCFEHR